MPSAHNGGDAARVKFVQAQRDHKAVCEANELKPGEGLSKYRHEAGKPPKAVYDIQSAYMMAVNNVTRFIYIENQYFRWPPLAEHLKALARTYQEQGRTEPLYLFVVTNDTEDGVGSGTLKTQEMLASLGRAETIPEITKLRMIKEMKKNAPARPQVDSPRDYLGRKGCLNSRPK